MDADRQIRLFIDPEIREVLEKRRLKDEEIRKTLSAAEKSGRKFVHPGTGHFLAGMRQDAMTVWVEYSPREDGFAIHKAYPYRLEISAWDLRTGRTLALTLFCLSRRSAELKKQVLAVVRRLFESLAAEMPTIHIHALPPEMLRWDSTGMIKRTLGSPESMIAAAGGTIFCRESGS